MELAVVVVEDEGCTSSAVEEVVVSGFGLSDGEGFALRNTPPVVAEEDTDLTAGDHVDFKVSLFQEVSKRLLAGEALELLILLGLPLVDVVKRPPLTDGVLDVVLVEGPNAKKPVALGDGPLDASLSAVVPNTRSVELACEAGSWENRGLRLPNRAPDGAACETPPLLEDDVAFEANRLSNVPLLGDTPLEPGDTPTVDEDLVVPNKLLLSGVWVDVLLIGGAEFEPDRLASRDSVLF